MRSDARNIAEQAKQGQFKVRDGYARSATEVERNVAQVQGAKYETALYRLMNRTGSNTALINSLNGFIGAIDHRSVYGKEEEQLSSEQIQKLTDFFKEKSEELRNLIGNRPSTSV